MQFECDEKVDELHFARFSSMCLVHLHHKRFAWLRRVTESAIQSAWLSPCTLSDSSYEKKKKKKKEKMQSDTTKWFGGRE